MLGLKLDASYTHRALAARGSASAARSLEADYDYTEHRRASSPDYPFPRQPRPGHGQRPRAAAVGPNHFAAYVTSRVPRDRPAHGGGRPALGRADLRRRCRRPAGAAREPRLRRSATATRLRASWGRYQQFQGINELQVEDGVDQFFPAQQCRPHDPRPRARPAAGPDAARRGATARTTATRGRATRACTTRCRWCRSCAGTASRSRRIRRAPKASRCC